MQAGRMTSLLDRLAEIGARPDDTSEDRLRAGALILASIGIAAISCFWIGVYLAYGYESSAAIPFVYQIVTLVGLLALSRTKRFDIFRTTQLAAWLILPALLQITLGGFVASSGMILWAVLVPFAAVALLGVRRAMPWLLAFFVVLAALVLLNPRLAHHPHGFPRSLVVAFIVLNISGLVLGGFVLLGFFVDRSEQARRELAEEQELSEMLLRNMLPTAIAHRLKQGESTIAQALDQVTVLFADIEGFTRLSEEMPPEHVVGLLDRIFSAFDTLADLEGLEKIKTIGDAYMVVGGAPEPRIDHAQAIARLALAMRRALAPIAVSVARRLADPHRHRHRTRRRRRDRHAQVHLRPLGRHGEHRQPDGVPRRAGRDPADGARGRGAERRLRARAARPDRGQGQGARRDVLPVGRASA